MMNLKLIFYLYAQMHACMAGMYVNAFIPSFLPCFTFDFESFIHFDFECQSIHLPLFIDGSSKRFSSMKYNYPLEFIIDLCVCVSE